MGQTSSSLRRNLLAPVLIAGFACCRLVWAQEPLIPTLRGNVTAVQPPDGFDVAGYHVITMPDTEFFAQQGPKKDPAALRGARIEASLVSV